MLTLVIVGRPNVGKSTLFNRLSGFRKAIVGAKAGLTRDRVSEIVTIDDTKFILVDTGGFTLENESIDESIRNQISIALSESDIIIFLFDGKEGTTPVDEEVMALLRKTRKPVIYVVNKSDTKEMAMNIGDIYSLGIDEIVEISAEHGKGILDLEDKILSIAEGLEKKIKENIEPLDADLKLCVLGRPNAGKSTLVNKFIGSERMIVSEIAGTTVDPVDTLVEWNDTKILMVDTAGIRKKASVTSRIEKVAVLKAVRSLQRSDVALLLIDSDIGVTEVDKKIASEIDSSGCGVILAINKWDKVPGEERSSKKLEEYREWIWNQMPFMSYAPIVFVSAMTGKGLKDVVPLALEIKDGAKKRVKTGDLISTVKGALEKRPVLGVRFSYASQLGVSPPSFVVKANRPDKVTEQYKRFLAAEIRRNFDIKGIPIRIKISAK